VRVVIGRECQIGVRQLPPALNIIPPVYWGIIGIRMPPANLRPGPPEHPLNHPKTGAQKKGRERLGRRRVNCLLRSGDYYSELR